MDFNAPMILHSEGKGYRSTLCRGHGQEGDCVLAFEAGNRESKCGDAILVLCQL
jgi:hypothetical protein